MKVSKRQCLGLSYSLLILTPADGSILPEMSPGQFVQVDIPNSKGTYLRRPISINFVDKERNELWLLVRVAGDGTRLLAAIACGNILNLILPLGRGFSMPGNGRRVLLVGGGVGVAPLLYLGSELTRRGATPEFLLGARSAADLLLVDEFGKYGFVHVSTEDGSAGEKGLVTTNSIFSSSDFDLISCCGPMPMMKAVAAIAKNKGVECEVSLENMMACGLGACLCCVEKKADGHNVCVCTEGPVFKTSELSW